MIAYLQFKAGPAGPFQTIEVPARHSPRPRRGPDRRELAGDFPPK